MRALIIVAISLLALIGCKEGPDGVVTLTPLPAVWTVDSERLVIRENREGYTFYDFSRDTLPAKVKTALYALKTTDQGVVCRAGRETYEITITDNDGLDRVFASTDGRCGDLYPWGSFIAVAAIDNIVRLLKEAI